ncbi:hypothetical protein BC829DRAFT_286967 [Chytridium lagenaria]|nr:hypothetical protein BC829DRAFT_286967 [Chytridium lagenaria]
MAPLGLTSSLSAVLLAMTASMSLTSDVCSAVIPVINPEFISFKGPGFSGNIEAAGIDSRGFIYGVDYADPSTTSSGVTTIGKINPNDGSTSLFSNLASANYRGTMLVNGIRFTPSGDAFVADPGNRVVLRIPNGSAPNAVPQIVCDFEHIRVAGAGIPNDLVVAKDGTIYVSGANFASNTGGIYRCNPNTGVVSKLYEGRRTNGIDLDVNQRYLYFTDAGDREESISRIAISGNGSPELVFTFPLTMLPPEADLDGIRFDVDGNLYVTLNGAGRVAILDTTSVPVSADKVQYVGLEGKMSNPTNLEIGVRDGRPAVYVLGKSFVDGQPKTTGMISFPARAEGRQLTFLRS